jgi:hypothetical protein
MCDCSSAVVTTVNGYGWLRMKYIYCVKVDRDELVAMCGKRFAESRLNQRTSAWPKDVSRPDNPSPQLHHSLFFLS